MNEWMDGYRNKIMGIYLSKKKIMVLQLGFYLLSSFLKKYTIKKALELQKPIQ